MGRATLALKTCCGTAEESREGGFKKKRLSTSSFQKHRFLSEYSIAIALGHNPGISLHKGHNSNQVGGGISSDSAGSSAHAEHKLTSHGIERTASLLLYLLCYRHASSLAVRLLNKRLLGESIPLPGQRYGLFRAFTICRFVGRLRG